MKRLLPENRDLIARLARSRVLLAFDFDGTLAPIVAARAEARMRESTRTLFARVCELYPCAVISGRSRHDVALRLGNTPIRYVVGNHGIEPHGAAFGFRRTVRRGCMSLRRALNGFPGIDIEDKQYSLAIHYRSALRKTAARREIRSALKQIDPPMRIVPGKLVLNAIPSKAPHKGDALLRLRAIERADAVLYAGDDATDEDVFSLEHDGWLSSVRIGRSTRSSAQYYLRDQREIDGLLWSLSTARAFAPGEERLSDFP